jgi:hypothetical protein
LIDLWGTVWQVPESVFHYFNAKAADMNETPTHCE